MPTPRFHVATRKGLFRVVRSAKNTWHIKDAWFLGDNSSMVLRDARDETMYVALGHGHFGVKLHRSTDDGASWDECSAPMYPEKPEGVEDVDPVRKKPIPWSTQLVWSLEPGGPDQEGRLWCGTLPGGLFRSEDRGSSWELIRALWDDPVRKQWVGGGYDWPGIHSVCVHPENAERLTLGVSVGGVWVSEDDGASWTCGSQGMRAEYMPPEQAFDPVAQDPHRVVQCRTAPDHYWTQHHNGVFKSDDGSKSWTEIENIEPSTFGFAVVVHPHDPKTAWFVPGINDEKRIPVDGKLVVTRTRDGGGSFEVLRNGLPQKQAYDLTFRHAFDIDHDGEVLAFGTTTGSLWVSEDLGDSWHLVSHNLPPVHCVRFD